MTVQPLPRRQRNTGPAAGWFSRVFGGLLVIATGVLLGIQFTHPDKRVLAVMIALVVFGVAWRLEMISAIGVVVLTLPYPRTTVFGNTNLALILMLIVIWLLRVSQRQSSPLARTPVDAPIAGLLAAYVISFYNLASPAHLQPALTHMQLVIAGILLFYLITTNVRTEDDLRRLHGFQLFSLVTMCLVAVYELNHPGGALIPGWIEFRGTLGDEFNRHNVRVGGPFFDFELMAEFCAFSLLFVVFLLMRARSNTRRALLAGVLALNCFVLFTTVTRGAMVSLAAALGYMLWLTRRQHRFVPMTILLSMVAAAFVGMNFFVSEFTVSGDLMARLGATEMHGLVPDSRVGAWKDGWERFLLNPIFGHGPYYAPMIGTRTWFWPHNGYLFIANLVGIVGLAFYLWLTLRLWWISRPDVDRLNHPSYARAFQVITHLQLSLFLVDQIKIDFLRNQIYPFQVWLLFATVVVTNRIARHDTVAEAEASAEAST